MKKVHLKMFIVLIVVGVFSGGSLAVMYRFTQAPIQNTQQKELKEAVFKVIPDAKDYNEIKSVDSTVIYKVTGQDGETAGYAVAGEGGGFQGNIRLMVGLDKNMESITGIEILESMETPGLGERVKDEPFRSQFFGMKIPEGVTIGCVKNEKDKKETDIQAITGATISSEAVVSIVNELIAEARGNIKQ
jgi:electron transport complex protein RnfG